MRHPDVLVLEAETWRAAVLKRLMTVGAIKGPCEVCGGVWVVADGFFTFTSFRAVDPEVTMESSIGSVWLVMLGCVDCGCTRFVDARKHGLDQLATMRETAA